MGPFVQPRGVELGPSLHDLPLPGSPPDELIHGCPTTIFQQWIGIRMSWIHPHHPPMCKHKGCGGESQGNWPESPDSPGRTAWAERSNIGMGCERALLVCTISRESVRESLHVAFDAIFPKKEAPSVASRLTLRSTPSRAKAEREKSGGGKNGEFQECVPVALCRVRRYCVAMSCIPKYCRRRRNRSVTHHGRQLYL